MHWEEDREQERYVVPDDVMDLLFDIECPTLPVDHAWALSSEVRRVLPWFEQERQAGLHIIHGADSGNGWERPQGAEDLLHLSRRVKLTLRLPRYRITDASELTGETFDISGHRMVIGSPKTRRLSATNILYSRYLACPGEGDEEEAFMAWAVAELKSAGVAFKKALCGRPGRLTTPDGPVITRSLMVADLSHEDAVALQESGMGPRRHMGCGLFIPQKSF